MNLLIYRREGLYACHVYERDRTFVLVLYYDKVTITIPGITADLLEQLVENASDMFETVTDEG